MALITELFTSEEGLMSLAVLVFMIGMAIYLFRMFIKNMNKPRKK